LERTKNKHAKLQMLDTIMFINTLQYSNYFYIETHQISTFVQTLNNIGNSIA